MIDACVLYPTVMREMVVGAAAAGFFEPVWSARVLEEWARAARKLSPEGEAQARTEIALLQARFPKAERTVNAGTENRLWLPDPADVHVLACAVDAGADALLTLNAKDFPRNILAEEDIIRRDPDGMLVELWLARPEAIEAVAQSVLSEANRLSSQVWHLRALMKKARLPRLGKALGD